MTDAKLKLPPIDAKEAADELREGRFSKAFILLASLIDRMPKEPPVLVPVERRPRTFYDKAQDKGLICMSAADFNFDCRDCGGTISCHADDCPADFVCQWCNPNAKNVAIQ